MHINDVHCTLNVWNVYCLCTAYKNNELRRNSWVTFLSNKIKMSSKSLSYWVCVKERRYSVVTKMLYFYSFFYSYSTLRFAAKFEFASLHWKQTRSTWNFNIMCRTAQFVSNTFFSNLTCFSCCNETFWATTSSSLKQQTIYSSWHYDVTFAVVRAMTRTYYECANSVFLTLEGAKIIVWKRMNILSRKRILAKSV